MTIVSLPQSLDLRSLDQLHAELSTACEIDEVLVLRGRSDVFCNGMDLGALREPENARSEAVEVFGELLIALRFAPVAVIAVVEGSVRGGGVGLAAAADWVIANTDSQFSLPEVSLGLQPATILPVFVERVGRIRARQVSLRATGFSANDAYKMGLVDELVESTDIESSLRRRIREFGRGRHRAIAGIKSTSADSALKTAIRAGAKQTANDVCNPAIVDPILDYLDGGVPPWSRI